MHGKPCDRRQQRGNTFAGVMVGLLIGVVVAVGVALYINFGPKPFVKSGAAPQPAVPTAPAPSASAPAALPGKPGDKPLDKPAQQYDFYQILPGGDAASAPAQPAKTEPPAADKVYLQAGAFQDPADADNLKARLSLMGIEAGVQKIEVSGKGFFHRVRIGPFAAQGEADAMRARLAQEGIESAVVRTKAQSAATKP